MSHQHVKEGQKRPNKRRTTKMTCYSRLPLIGKISLKFDKQAKVAIKEATEQTCSASHRIFNQEDFTLQSTK